MKPIIPKTIQELSYMQTGGKILAKALKAMKAASKPGVSTWEVDQVGREVVAQHGMQCAFYGYHGFPGAACISINDQVVHGVPKKETIIQEGDIVKIDFGVLHQGLNTDACISFGAGEISAEEQSFLDTVKAALYAAIAEAKEGNHLGDISAAIQETLEEGGAVVVRDLTGHGIGKEVHEQPTILNYGSRGTGMQLVAGQTLAIEPIATMGGSGKIFTDSADGWTIYSTDGALGGHFEHTIVIGKEKGEVLTPWEG